MKNMLTVLFKELRELSRDRHLCFSIAATPGVDGVFIGPGDLSASMGLTGCFDHPDFLAALAQIEQKAEAHGKAKGYHVVQPNPDDLRAKAAQGYTFLAYGIDALFLQHAGRRPGA